MNTGKTFNTDVATRYVIDFQNSAMLENVLGNSPTHPKLGSDQLRQRVAYALSQILVVSTTEHPLYHHAESLAFFFDTLAKNAFGNYRTLLGEVARHPAMGVFLSMQGNAKYNPRTGSKPDENFAREALQLFTIGLYELNIDGSLNNDGNPLTINDNASRPLPAYEQHDVEELAKIMTGWTLADQRFGKSGAKRGNYARPMQFFEQFHEQERAEKGDGLVTVLGHTINLRKGDGQDHLNQALDILFAHPNVGPFVSKHLIQRLVTSNPSKAYIQRVATVFNNNGKDVRGDMKATLKAVLLDVEARQTPKNEQFGQVKEPLLAFTQFLRAFNGQPGIHYNKALAYWFNQPERYIGQAALRSPTVFNFFSPEFVPNDDSFKSEMRSAPEMEIQQNSELINFNNVIFRTLFNNDKAKIQKRQQRRADSGKKVKPPEYAIFLNLDGYENRLKDRLDGNLSLLSSKPNSTTATSAINSLIDEMSMRLGAKLDTEQKQQLNHFLINSQATQQGSAKNHANRIVTHCAYFLATAPQFRVQR